MPIKVKMGSALTGALPAGWKLTSANATITVSGGPGGAITVTAAAAGNGTLTLEPAKDVRVSLDLVVVA